jgi:predicted Zn-dependent protease
VAHYGYLISAKIKTSECDALALAHEIGHALGLYVHATRPGALMTHTGEGWDVSAEELAAIDRTVIACR